MSRRPEAYEYPRLDTPCSYCGCPLPKRLTGWTCRTCRWLYSRGYLRRRRSACIQCGGELPKHRSKFCSKECDLTYRGAINVFADCVVCGARFQTHNGVVTCSSVCWKERRREHHRRKNRKRRLNRVPGAYSLAYIAERDGYGCHLCGEKVDMSRKDVWGPSVDHLVPISAGGEDCKANVALAHRICNSRRADKGEAQLLLFG